MTSKSCAWRNRVAALVLCISAACALAQSEHPAQPASATAAATPAPALPAASLPAPSASTPGFPGIPLQRDQPSASNAQSALFALLFLLAIAGAGFFLVRHRGRVAAQSPGAAARIVSRTSLTNQATLHTVEWDGKELLLGVTANSVTVLAQRTLPRDSGTGEAVK